jgi:hypothetical protein
VSVSEALEADVLDRMQEALALKGPPPKPRTVNVPDVFRTSGVSELFAELGGAVFAEGAYRVHDPACAARWTELTVAAFPQLERGIMCFASDWLGRQLAVSTEAAPNGRPGVVLVDLQSDDVLRTECDLEDFHDRLLVEHAESILVLDLYRRWRSAGGAMPSASECVEYTVPLYLGGADDVSNLAVVNMEVAWGLAAQLLRQVRKLPEGTSISDIDIS